MYLLVFTMLIIGILGIYSQVFAIEMARFFANQTGIADTMITWHEAGMSIAEFVMNPTQQPASFATEGCRVTNSTWSGAPPICQKGTLSGITGSPNATVVGNGTYTYTNVSLGITYTYPYLPNYSGLTYNSVPYEWKSIAFQNGGNSYLLTYVDPTSVSATNPAPGFISTASASGQLGITTGDFFNQVKNSGVSPLNYGYVINNGPNDMLVTTVMLPTGPVTYPLPPAGVVPDRAVAIISNFTPCNTC